MFSFQSRVIDLKPLTEDVILISLTVPDDFSFIAGQFVTLTVSDDKQKQARSYSILNPTTKKSVIDLCIKLIPDGFASDVFSKTRLGDVFNVKGPLGRFHFDEKTSLNDHWFIGTGTGIAPLYSMLYTYLPKYKEKKFTLLAGFRWKKNLLFHQGFLELTQQHNNFSYNPILSKEEWSGLKGHVQDHLPKDIKGKKFYICGLKDMVLGAREQLLKKGVEPENIEYERYN